MDEILFKLLEQTPVIIALGVGIYALWKDKKQVNKDGILERKFQTKQIKELTENHAGELKILNEYIRSRDMETLESLEELTAAISDIKNAIETKI